MMNRREFVKKGSLVTLAASLPFAARANVINEQKVFENIFQPIEFSPGQNPEFPLDFIWPGEKREYQAYTSVNHKIEQIMGSDYILVPTPYNNQNRASDYDRVMETMSLENYRLC